MKRKAISVLVLLCIIVSFVLPAGKAAGTVYFSVINNSIQPLKDQTMPAYFNGLLYLPYSFFNTDQLSVYSNGDDNLAIIYSSVSKRLTFNVAEGTVVDQDKFQYTQYSPRFNNGRIYVPAEFVCRFFGLTLNNIQAEPANIIRVQTSSNAISDEIFVKIKSVNDEMRAMYDAYTGNTSSAPSPTSSSDVGPVYPNVTIYLSFFEISGGKLPSILDTLDATSYKACFFVARDEIEANTGLLREAAGKGHMIGIWLKDGTYQEYQDATALLFEAAKIKTVIVTARADESDADESGTDESGTDLAKTAEEMAKTESLVYWRQTRSYDATAKFSVTGLTGSLATVSGRESLAFACSEKTSIVLSSFLSYLAQHKYSVRRIGETSIPILSANSPA